MNTALYFCITDLSPNPPNEPQKSTQPGKAHPEVPEGVPALRGEPGVPGDLELSSPKRQRGASGVGRAGRAWRRAGERRKARKEEGKEEGRKGGRGSGRGREGPGDARIYHNAAASASPLRAAAARPGHLLRGCGRAEPSGAGPGWGWGWGRRLPGCGWVRGKEAPFSPPLHRCWSKRRLPDAFSPPESLLCCLLAGEQLRSRAACCLPSPASVKMVNRVLALPHG